MSAAFVFEKWKTFKDFIKLKWNEIPFRLICEKDVWKICWILLKTNLSFTTLGADDLFMCCFCILCIGLETFIRKKRHRKRNSMLKFYDGQMLRGFLVHDLQSISMKMGENSILIFFWKYLKLRCLIDLLGNLIFCGI